MPVCITGMHRSGTSMITRLLNLCGLYLGSAESIMPPDEGNPTGYWQNVEMDELSEAILAVFSKGWDFLLPVMESGWEHREELDPIRTRAENCVAGLKANRPWGWKDPRASLTIPFWKSLVPELKVVVCLRNPLEVAESLHKHTGSTAAFTYNLWIRYYQRILEDVPQESRIITHYDSYFINAQDELSRLLNWLGWDVTTIQIESALSFISSEYRKHRVVSEDQARHRVPVEVVEMYENLCLEAGEIAASAIENGDLPKLVPWEAIGFRLPERDAIPPENITKAEAAFKQAHTLIEKNRINEAIDKLELVLSLFPHHSQAQNDLGVLHLAGGNNERAVAHLSQARRLTRDNSYTMKNLAEAFMKVGRIEDAIQTMLDLVQRQPDDLEVLYWLGIACESQGQKRAAREFFSRIQQLKPDHQEARQRLAALRDDLPLTA